MQLSQIIQFVASFYIYFEAISFHLITRGFVNPIPEYTNVGQSDSDKGPENFEPSGIGDGETTGAKVIITRITTYDNLITILFVLLLIKLSPILLRMLEIKLKILSKLRD